MNWHYEEAGEQRGPVSEEEIHTMIHEGVINERTLVWRVGMGDWQPAGRVQGLCLPPPLPMPNVPPVSPATEDSNLESDFITAHGRMRSNPPILDGSEQERSLSPQAPASAMSATALVANFFLGATAAVAVLCIIGFFLEAIR